MAWFGKVLGGAMGAMLGGPIGAAVGIVLGHQIDKGATSLEEDADYRGRDNTAVQHAFFDATFSIMGHLAKADGRVSEEEIQRARLIMQRMGLNETQKLAAIARFNEGKHPDFELTETLQRLKSTAPRRRDLMQLFIEIQIEMLFSDGEIDPTEYQLINHIAAQLGFSELALQHLIALVQGERIFENEQAHDERARSSRSTRPDQLTAAYRVIGVDASASDADIKKAYRKLMAQHHPDKLIAQGLPQEMVNAATRRVQEIQDAYECIKKSRA